MRMKKAINILISIAIIFGVCFLINRFDFNDHTYTATITDKNRIYTKGFSYYLVYTEDENGDVLVLKDKDTLFRWKFDSSDVYANLKVGDTYKFDVVGYRIKPLSCYENIIKYEKK